MKKLLAILMALSLALTPALAEENTEPAAQEATEEASTKIALTPRQQEQIIYNYAHIIADDYYYGISDSNLLYSIICATIENDGKFDVDLSLQAMIDILDDEYAEFYPQEAYDEQLNFYTAAFYGLGIVLTLQDGGTVIDSVYAGGSGEEAGLLAGDRIMAVDGVDTSAMLPADVRSLISGEVEGSAVQVTVLRTDELITVNAIRRKVSESHSTMEILENDIAYIDIASFTASLPEDFDKYISTLSEQGITKVIIDLRDNGGGDLDAAMEVAKKLIPAGVIGKVKTMKNGTHVEEVVSENLTAPEYNMLVLVNENTASASEFLAMALQSSGRAKLMGTHTYGKGCLQVIMRTPTGSGIKFTAGEYFSPKDERIHTVGLTPDLPVENIVTPITREDFTEIDLLQLDSESTRLGIEERLGALRLLPESEIDGVLNNYTEAAIRVFQRLSGYEETGLLDFYTAMHINDYEYDGLFRVTDVQTTEALKYFENN